MIVVRKNQHASLHHTPNTVAVYIVILLLQFSAPRNPQHQFVYLYIIYLIRALITTTSSKPYIVLPAHRCTNTFLARDFASSVHDLIGTIKHPMIAAASYSLLVMRLLPPVGKI